MKYNIHLKLTQKIMLMVSIILVMSIAGISLISTNKASGYITALAKDDLAHMAVLTRSMCQMEAEASKKKVAADLNVARKLFQQYAKNGVVVENNQMIVDPNGERIVLNDNHEFVDDITSQTGSRCTIFLNEQGQSRRITTSVLNEKGTRATGTLLSQEVYDEVVRARRAYFGRAWVVDKYFTTAYEPILDTGRNVIGVLFVGAEERSEILREHILSMKVGTAGYIYTMDKEGVLRIHPKLEGESISQHAFAQEMIAKAPQLSEKDIGWITYEWDRNGVMAEKIVAYTYFPDWDWIIGAGSYLDEFTAPVNDIRQAIILLGVICLISALIIAFFMARTIVRPIIRLVGVAREVAVGDVSSQIETDSRDEVGMLATSFDEMMHYLRESAQIAERIGNNDLTVSVKPRSGRDMLGNSFQKMVTNLRGVIGQLKQNADQLASAATEIVSASEEMAQGAAAQSEQATQVSSAIEEMAGIIIESSKNAAEARGMAEKAATTAQSGGGIVSSTINGMVEIALAAKESGQIVNELAKASDKIGEIIGVIDDIADQTNLLALNAAIEAARAGEQGRGFAVVADEVRKLAERTGKATGEITEMIKGIQNGSGRAVSSMQKAGDKVVEGKEMADKAGQSLSEINTISSHVMEMVVQIATAAEEQSAAAEQISKNMEHITSVIKQTATGAQESASSAEQLNKQATDLQRIVGQFKVED